MATFGRTISYFLRQQTTNNFIRNRILLRVQPVRCKTTTETGAILAKPTSVGFGLPKVLVVLAPLLYFGATISKEGAAFLEENDIFIPDDDDD